MTRKIRRQFFKPFDVDAINRQDNTLEVVFKAWSKDLKTKHEVVMRLNTFFIPYIVQELSRTLAIKERSLATIRQRMLDAAHDTGERG